MSLWAVQYIPCRSKFLFLHRCAKSIQRPYHPLFKRLLKCHKSHVRHINERAARPAVAAYKKYKKQIIMLRNVLIDYT